MKKLVLIVLLLAGCTKADENCAEINADPEKIVARCGKPKKVLYRNQRLWQFNYWDNGDDANLTVEFDQFEKVVYWKYSSPRIDKEGYRGE